MRARCNECRQRRRGECGCMRPSCTCAHTTRKGNSSFDTRSVRESVRKELLDQCAPSQAGCVRQAPSAARAPSTDAAACRPLRRWVRRNCADGTLTCAGGQRTATSSISAKRRCKSAAKLEHLALREHRSSTSVNAWDPSSLGLPESAIESHFCRIETRSSAAVLQLSCFPIRRIWVCKPFAETSTETKLFGHSLRPATAITAKRIGLRVDRVLIRLTLLPMRDRSC